MKWYSKAADQGNDNSQYYLGLCCYNGTGTPQDKAAAQSWLEKAAANGNKDAKVFLKKHMKLGRLW